LSHYEVDDYICAMYIGDSWVSLYNQPYAFDECS